MSNLATIEQGDMRRVIMEKMLVLSSGCWEWRGALSRGYGQLTYKGKHTTAHRFSFDAFKGPIDQSLWVLHTCDNRKCVNPEHLYQGTPANNRADMLNRGRWSHPYASRLACFAGHVYDEVGYRLDKDGSRVCRECQKLRKREYRAKNRCAV